MKSKLFIFQLSCLFLSHLNYSTEEVTKSATKQILVSLGTSVITTVIWANKESIYNTIKGTLWVAEAVTNHRSHKKTQEKVEKTHDLLATVVHPEMTTSFKGLKELLDKTNNNTNIILPHIEEMKEKIGRIDSTTQALTNTITASNTTTVNKIDQLLNNVNKNVNDFLAPIKETTEQSLQLNKKIDQRTLNMAAKIDRILEHIEKK